jgi:Fur family peroxide stress response transcriptional regulator
MELNTHDQKKIKSSRQRDCILRILRSTKIHPTADWIYESARKDLPNISLGTVYRNLNLLRDEGKIKELCYGKGISRYDVPHISLRASSIEVEEMTGFRIHYHRLEFIGLCPDCINRSEIPWRSQL